MRSPGLSLPPVPSRSSLALSVSFLGAGVLGCITWTLSWVNIKLVTCSLGVSVREAP